MRLGKARYARECPLCQKLIRAGDEIACKWVEGRYTWGHVTCFMPWQVERDTRRLDAEFRAVMAGP